MWLGVQAWRHAGKVEKATAPSARVHAWRGFIVAITNPKTIAFFTAFLPQFLDPALPVQRQLFVMCVCSIMLGMALDSCWAVTAGFGRAFLMKPHYNKLLGRISALVLIGGGVWLSLVRARA
jgi:threonine/homoserine/homoserine lactone efflux protein